MIHHLRHGWIYFARHDRRSRLHGGKRDLRQSRARAHAEQAKIARDLADLDGEPAHRARVGEHVAHALRHAKQIHCGTQRGRRVSRQVLDDELSIVVAGVEAGADRRRADVELAQLL